VAKTLMADKREHYGPKTPEEYFTSSKVAVRSAYDTLDWCLKTHGRRAFVLAPYYSWPWNGNRTTFIWPR
jgi:hypothetical protein